MISDMLTKLTVLGIIGALLTVILKKYSSELVIFFEIAVVAVAVFIIKDSVSDYIGEFGKMFSSFGSGSELFGAVFKAAAVTLLSRLGSEICRESGNGLMGDIVELGGRVMLIILALPFVEKVTEIALAFVK